MYNFVLPNKATINVDLLVETVVESSDWPRVFLDTRSGAVISIANEDSHKVWLETSKPANYILDVPLFTIDDRKERAMSFVKLILQSELNKKSLAQVSNFIKLGDFDAFEHFLEVKTDGFIHAWDQFIYDEAHEHVSSWLLNNPQVKITQVFEGCGNCEICTAMKQNPSDSNALFNAFATEEVMRSVGAQIRARTQTADIVVREVPQNVFVLKISLNDSKPLIWRRIMVPENYTFFELHCAIQDAMGWMDGHLHDFKLLDTKSDKSVKEGATIITLPTVDPGEHPIFETKNERTELLKDWFDTKMKQCLYEYDFGDGWDHTVLLEKIEAFDPNATYPQCLAGAQACPPEDCGGIGGYEHIKNVLKNKKGREYKQLLEWLDLDSVDDFKPDYFEPLDVEFYDPTETWQEYQSFRGYK